MSNIPKIGFSHATGTFRIAFPGQPEMEISAQAALVHWQEPGSAEWTPIATDQILLRLNGPKQAKPAPCSQSLELELLIALENLINRIDAAEEGESVVSPSRYSDHVAKAREVITKALTKTPQ